MNEFKWYVLKVVSGQEKKVKDAVELGLRSSKWANCIEQLVIPYEKVYKLHKGKKVLSEKNFLPGYLLFYGDLADKDMINFIRSVSNVLGFLSGNRWTISSDPVALRQYDVDNIFKRIEGVRDLDKVGPEKSFIVGESVKIVDGPFNSFIGDIQEIFDDRKKLIVMVKIFGRDTPVELSYFQVEKSK
jgi:transcriptional antiterminator NusG